MSKKTTCRNPRSQPKTIGYYLDRPKPACPLTQRKRVVEFYNQLPKDALFYTEKAEACGDRPLWKEILWLMRRDKVTILIVPTVHHIAGGDREELRTILAYARKKNVRIRCLYDGLDSSNHEISAFVFEASR